MGCGLHPAALHTYLHPSQISTKPQMLQLPRAIGFGVPFVPRWSMDLLQDSPWEATEPWWYHPCLAQESLISEAMQNHCSWEQDWHNSGREAVTESNHKEAKASTQGSLWQSSPPQVKAALSQNPTKRRAQCLPVFIRVTFPAEHGARTPREKGQALPTGVSQRPRRE